MGVENIESGIRINIYFLYRFDSIWRMTEAMPQQFECDEDIQNCSELL